MATDATRHVFDQGSTRLYLDIYGFYGYAWVVLWIYTASELELHHLQSLGAHASHFHASIPTDGERCFVVQVACSRMSVTTFSRCVSLQRSAFMLPASNSQLRVVD